MVNQCRNCGHFFQSTPNPRRPRLFCSDRCRKAWSRKHQIPQALRALRRWVRADGKRPIMCDGSPASSTDSSTWASYSEVMRSKAGDGYGIMLGDGLACWDFDHVDLTSPPAKAMELLPDRSMRRFRPADMGCMCSCGRRRRASGVPVSSFIRIRGLFA